MLGHVVVIILDSLDGLIGEPRAKGLWVAASKLNACRPWDGLCFGWGCCVVERMHALGALTLGTEWWEDKLLLSLTEWLTLPGEEVQEEHQGRVESAVGH